MENRNVSRGERDEELLTRAMQSWQGAQEFRDRRDRCKRMTYGNQWGDLVSESGYSQDEAEYMRAHGYTPLTNNLIRRLVRNVLGVFRNRWREPVCRARDIRERSQAETMQKLLICNSESNRLAELHARTFEEFLISGMAVHKKWFGPRNGVSDCQTDMVSPSRFFIDSEARDVRGGDVTMLGEIHELSFEQLCASFATSPGECRRLMEIYGVASSEPHSRRCRVMEVWEKSYPERYVCRDRRTGRVFRADERGIVEVERENRHRLRATAGNPARDPGLIESKWRLESEWRYSFLTPQGDVLGNGVSPYAHGEHPYVWKAYPFIDGEVHSFVYDVIDQQKLTNRLVTMYDWMVRTSAKGALLLPEDAIPHGVNPAEVAEQWRRFEGVILYRHHTGNPIPQQIYSKGSNSGLTELLELQMKLMEDVSGVNGALQGKLASGSISGTLFNQQTQNSLSALSDILESYDDFILRGTEKDADNIRQFYPESRIAAIVGNHPGAVTRFIPTPGFFHTPFDFSFRQE